MCWATLSHHQVIEKEKKEEKKLNNYTIQHSKTKSIDKYIVNVLWSRASVCLSVCLCVCVSVRGRMPTLLDGPGCNLQACANPATWRHSAKLRTLGGSLRAKLAGDWRVTVSVLNITAAAWTAGFHLWRSGNITRTQNVSECSTRSMPSCYSYCDFVTTFYSHHWFVLHGLLF